MKDIKDVSLYEWKILDLAIKELKRERASRQDEGEDKRIAKKINIEENKNNG